MELCVVGLFTAYKVQLFAVGLFSAYRVELCGVGLFSTCIESAVVCSWII